MNFYNLQNITETLIFIVPLRFYVRSDIPTGSNRKDTEMSQQFMVETLFVHFFLRKDFPTSSNTFFKASYLGRLYFYCKYCNEMNLKYQMFSSTISF